MPQLFPAEEDELDAPLDSATDSPSGAPAHPGPFAGVALEQSIDRVLDYAIPPALATTVRVGQRVKVPLGPRNRPSWGYVVGIQPQSTYPKIKPLLAVEDQRVLINDELLQLARWISRYYVTPLGAVIETMVPSAVKKRIGLGYLWLASLAGDRQAAQDAFEHVRGKKRKAILARLLQLEPGESIELQRLAGQAGTTIATIRAFARQGPIRLSQEPDLPRLAAPLDDEAAEPAPAEAAIQLNADQQRAMDELLPRMAGGFSVNLLLGVTGSGKTELYLRCIRAVVDAGKQAIVLVPEIALTPQTVRRFTARFSRVAVLHSGLTASQRHRFWQQVAQGHAQVVVGARSAVFAPLPNLGIIVVDEEHESSYKQDQAPRYHARDVAVKRAQLVGIPIILGSATPSLETWRRFDRPVAENAPAENAPPAPVHHLLQLPNRVRERALPQVELIDLKAELRLRRASGTGGGGIHLLSLRLEKLLEKTIADGHQAMLLLNRRGYSNFVYCPSCTHLVHCKYCDTTMTYHRSAAAAARGATAAEGAHTGQLHCHYCLAVSPLPQTCPDCGKKLSLFGLGTQRVEEELARKFPRLRFARVDSDTMRNTRDYERTLARFAAKELDVLLGTQMIAKGLDYPNVTLVGVISADTALALPDFRAAERTFQLITQVAGRAGRGDAPGRVVVQTFLPDDPAIRSAMKQDFIGFARRELVSRREVNLPPYTRMARIILRDQDLDHLNELSTALAAELIAAIAASAGTTIEMKGPMPCPVNRIAGYHRAQIVLKSADPRAIQRVLSAVRTRGVLSKSDRIAVDVDPVSLL